MGTGKLPVYLFLVENSDFMIQAEYLYIRQIRQHMFDTFKAHLHAIVRAWSSLTEKYKHFFAVNEAIDLSLRKCRNTSREILISFLFSVLD